MERTTPIPIYILQDIPGKGKGLVANEKIPRGTRILSETPIITAPQYEINTKETQKSLSEQVNVLNENERQALLSLSNIYPSSSVGDTVYGIFRTVGLPIEDDGIGGGVFLEACRINHACDNNAQKHWNENIKRHTIHALRDIEKGEEITVYYLGRDMDRKARQEALQAKFHFTCTCRLCSLPTEQSLESDKRIEDIERLESLIGREFVRGIMSSPLRILHYVDQQVRLYNEQGPGDPGLARAFFDATQITIANGDLARGVVFAEKAVSAWRATQGNDSKQVIEYEPLAQDPTKHSLYHTMYGMSMKWKTTVDEKPRELGEEEFEDWLWRREKPRRPGQFASLRNRVTFPPFVDLPNEYDFDPELSHWCYLGEIVDSYTLMRLQLEIKDVDDRKIPLFFYTEDRGNEIPPAQLQKGHTVAILDAKHHNFMYGEPGIRLENHKLMKVTQPLPS